MSQSVAIVTTLRDAGAVLNSYITYHLSIGFDHLFLFFDDPDDLSIPEAQKYPQVTVIRNDEKLRRLWKETRVYKEDELSRRYLEAKGDALGTLIIKQELNVEVAIQLAMEAGIDWLLHIDVDELFYSPHQTVQEHVDSLSASNIRHESYFNYEAIPEQADILDYFKEVILFKKNPRSITGEWLDDRQQELIEPVPQLPYTFFLLYANGKSAARVRPGLLPKGPHRFILPEEQRRSYRLRQYLRRKTHLALRSVVTRTPVVSRWVRHFRHQKSDKPKANQVNKNPIVLHYPVCGFEKFWTKYVTLGEYPEKLFGIDNVIKFNLEARDVVTRGGRQMAKDFYEGRVVMHDEAQINYLIENDLLCRISEPASLIQENTLAQYS